MIHPNGRLWPKADVPLAVTDCESVGLNHLIPLLGLFSG
jgi:hypothetical protein